MEKRPLEEQWVRWEPIKNLSPKYWIDSISDNLDNLTLILSDDNEEGNSVKIIFQGLVHSFRSIDEGLRLKTWHDLGEKYGVDFYMNWTCFKVKNSKYIAWLSKQSHETSALRNVTHFSLLDANSIVDILAEQEPKVEFL